MSAQHTSVIPEIIYLQWFGDEDPDCMTKAERERKPTMDEVSWCWHRIFEYDIEYIQLAKYKELEQQRDELREQIKLLWDAYPNADWREDVMSPREVERFGRKLDDLLAIAKAGEL